MGMSQFYSKKKEKCTGKGLHSVINAIIALSLQKSKWAPKGTRAERDVCPASSVSSGAKIPVSLAESAPITGCMQKARVLVALRRSF